MNSNTKKKVNTGKRKVIIILIVLGILIFLAILILVWRIYRKPTFTGERISFSISGPENIKTGDLFTYEVFYENNEEVALRDVEINLFYPEGFSFEQSNPKSQNFTENRWYIRSISPKSSGKIVISGKLYGVPGDIKKCKAHFRYTPLNFNASFTEEAEVITKIDKINLSLSSNFPKLVSKESDLQYEVTIKNEENYDLLNVEINIDYPLAFEFKSADPNPKNANNVWIFDRIESGKEVKIKIAEKVFGELEEKKFLNIKVGIRNHSGEVFMQAEKKFETKIAKIEANISYEVLGQKNISVNPGDLLEFKIHYKNTGTEDLPNVRVESEIDTRFFEKENFVIEGGTLSDSKIIWDKSGVSNFASLKNGAEGDLIFKAKILQDLSSLKMTNLKIVSKAKIFASDQEKGISFFSESNEIEIKIITKVSMTLFGRYFDDQGSQIGSGPLPPKVGNTTTYRIYLMLSNTTNEVENAKVEIYLPLGVSWTGQKSVNLGNLVFIGEKMIWDIGKIQAESGSKTETLNANFEVGITPEEFQVGKTVTLVSKAKFFGKDTFTGKDINFEVGSVDTNLTNDPKVSGKGAVVR